MTSGTDIRHLAFTRALALAEASAMAPYDFVRLPIAALIGFFAFGEVPDVWTWVGAAIIFSATLYITHREAQLQRELAAREASGSGGEAQVTPPGG